MWSTNLLLENTQEYFTMEVASRKSLAKGKKNAELVVYFRGDWRFFLVTSDK